MYEDRKNAVITGSARGIGRGIAELLAQKGLNVVISDVLFEEAEKTAQEIAGRYGVKTLAVKTDVTDPAAAQQLMDETRRKLGSVDFLVNNAGVTKDNLSIRMSEKEWDLVLDVNLKGSFLCAQAATKEMMKQRFGRVVNIASIAGILGSAGQANYASSKAGLIGLTKVLARELGSRNITVNAVAPGFISTEMTDKLPDKVKEEYLAQIPLKRAGTVLDIAEAVAFLLSPAASYITGTVINVSGGLLI